MKEKLLQHYLKMGPRRFVVLTIMLLIIMDLLSGWYLKLSWVKKGLSDQMVLLSINNMKLHVSDFSRETILEMTGLMDQTFHFLLFLLFLNNLFFYFFYYKKKLWAQGYVLFYTISAAVLSATFIFDDTGLGTGWLMFNIGTVPVYLYLYLGVKFLKNETTLVPGKKGQ